MSRLARLIWLTASKRPLHWCAAFAGGFAADELLARCFSVGEVAGQISCLSFIINNRAKHAQSLFFLCFYLHFSSHLLCLATVSYLFVVGVSMQPTLEPEGDMLLMQGSFLCRNRIAKGDVVFAIRAGVDPRTTTVVKRVAAMVSAKCSLQTCTIN